MPTPEELLASGQGTQFDVQESGLWVTVAPSQGFLQAPTAQDAGDRIASFAGPDQLLVVRLVPAEVGAPEVGAPPADLARRMRLTATWLETLADKYERGEFGTEVVHA